MRKNKGFTLVELSTSLAFISVLLLSIAILTMQIGSVYNKGFTIREVDESGQAITKELQTALQRSAGAQTKFVTFNDGSTQKGGRLCAGNIVYAWNTRDAINDGSRPATNQHRNTNGTLDNNVRFVKFPGALDYYCLTNGSGGYNQIPTSAVELLGAGNSNVALAKFDYANYVPAGDASQLIHAIDIVIGTIDTELITSTGDGDSFCNSTSSKADEECAVNRFSFTARSGNEESGGDS